MNYNEYSKLLEKSIELYLGFFDNYNGENASRSDVKMHPVYDAIENILEDIGYDITGSYKTKSLRKGLRLKIEDDFVEHAVDLDIVGKKDNKIKFIELKGSSKNISKNRWNHQRDAIARSGVVNVLSEKIYNTTYNCYSQIILVEHSKLEKIIKLYRSATLFHNVDICIIPYVIKDKNVSIIHDGLDDCFKIENWIVRMK